MLKVIPLWGDIISVCLSEYFLLRRLQDDPQTETPSEVNYLRVGIIATLQEEVLKNVYVLLLDEAQFFKVVRESIGTN